MSDKDDIVNETVLQATVAVDGDLAIDSKINAIPLAHSGVVSSPNIDAPTISGGSSGGGNVCFTNISPCSFRQCVSVSDELDVNLKDFIDFLKKNNHQQIAEDLETDVTQPLFSVILKGLDYIGRLEKKVDTLSRLIRHTDSKLPDEVSDL